ncbi:MAG: hypothetical protein WC785_03420 [Tatlockia sp.]|jgi:hypothetical protein
MSSLKEALEELREGVAKSLGWDGEKADTNVAIANFSEYWDGPIQSLI